ncbi:alpha/beta hydrolase [Corynebacterium dentalis]|uniref:alpha/beta hydrolase n=1 Tax=Corynebacterium dentalis TaxID=2014528 RepID=UPI00259A16D0|nr:alpha/beta hydrolase [Corynebacterium dentalis]
MSFLDRFASLFSTDSSEPQTTIPAEPPHALRQHFAVSSREVNGFEVYSVAPMRFAETSATDVTHYDPHADSLGELPAADAATQAVLYLIPGGFAQPIKARNWDFIAQMAEAELRVEIPLYGLIPDYDCTHGLDLISAVYAQLVEDHGPEDISVIADSAGCSLALGTFIADSSLPVPRQFILNAPWVDLDLSNPGVEKYKDADPILDPTQLRPQGNLWAQGLVHAGITDPGHATAHPIVSPLNLPVERWQEVLAGATVDVWCGDRDLSFPDATALTDRLNEAGISATLHPQAGGVHMFHLTKSREAKAARKEMIALVTSQK